MTSRLEREPRPTPEELKSTLEIVASVDNMDGDVYPLAREVLELQAEVRQLRADLERVNAKYGVMASALAKQHLPRVTVIEPREPGAASGIVKVSREELAELYPEPNPIEDHLHQCAMMADTVKALVKAARYARGVAAYAGQSAVVQRLDEALEPFEGE